MAIPFQDRHRWFIRKIQDCFGFDEESVVESHLRRNGVLEKLENFFSAAGPTRIYFFYQVIKPQPIEDVLQQGPPTSPGRRYSSVTIKGQSKRFLPGPHSLPVSDCAQGSNEAQLFVTDG